MSKFITSFHKDIAKWYTDILKRAELVDYGPVKGTVVFKPYGYAIWKNIQNILTSYFEQDEIEEIYFPLLIPYSYLEKEQKHIEGFAPEVFIVERIGNKKIEPLLIRPTSEILFTNYFKDNYSSYKQLPVKLNQWVNVLRAEKNTRPFLRTSEFLWQEGHTLHETSQEAYEYTKKIFNLYEKFFNQHLDMFALTGEKTVNERFAGADNTFTVETILKDGKSLQSATSHFLGQTFTKAFDVSVQDKNQQNITPFQTSWGISTRSIGAIIMSHSDDNGLILPWDVAPYHIIITTINSKKDDKITTKAKDLQHQLQSFGFRVRVDDSDKSLGFKAIEWEIKGVPLRMELGSNDLENKSVILINRSTNERETIGFEKITQSLIEEKRNNYKKDLFDRTKKHTNDFIKDVTTLEELKEVIEKDHVARAYWKDDSIFEETLRQKVEGATVRLLQTIEKSGKCIHSGEKTNTIAIIAKVY